MMIMNLNRKHMKIKRGGELMAGSMLLEVVLAIAVFAFGMLALVQLQGNLARSSADANTRTIAASIAEEFVERARGFTSVEADATTAAWEYKEMTEAVLTTTVTRGGVLYTVTASVDDYWYDPDPDVANFIATPSDTPPEKLSHLVYSDFKLLNLNVSWNDSPEFVVDDVPTNNVGLGSGSINIIEIVPGTPPILGAKVVAEDDGKPSGPPVPYHPGKAPDIIKLGLDNGVFKEATSPVPDLIHSDESVETWFDVVTYNQISAESAIFLRREEFLAVTCECELQTPDTGEGGLTPTLFNGYGYTEGKLVKKNFGVEAQAAQQSDYCDICCRDHHDGAAYGGVVSLDPQNPLDPGLVDSDPQSLRYGPPSGGISSDHMHYGYTKKGEFVEADQDGDVYLEACRLIRKDGFMRVTQDFSQDGFYGFPEGYLETAEGALAYGTFVISAAEDYYGTNASSMIQPVETTPAYVIPASLEDWSNATNLPTVPSAVKPISTEDQQLRTRGVYLDYWTVEAQKNKADCFDGSDETVCINPYIDPAVSSPTEMYPFFDVQLTWLTRWNEIDDTADPVDVTNEPVETGNMHDRGRSFLAGSKVGQSEVEATSHDGNLGLTATGPIAKDADAGVYENYSLFIIASNVDASVPSDGFSISGSLGTEVNSVKPADFILTPGDDVHCGQTDTDYGCFVPFDAGDLTLTISNYVAKFSLWICSDNAALNAIPSTRTDTETTFYLPPANVSGANIWVQNSSCSAL